MSSKMIMGMAIGAALGMYVASKNKKVQKAVSNAEDAVMTKVNQMSQGSSSQSQSSNMQ